MLVLSEVEIDFTISDVIISNTLYELDYEQVAGVSLFSFTAAYSVLVENIHWEFDLSRSQLAKFIFAAAREVVIQNCTLLGNQAKQISSAGISIKF